LGWVTFVLIALASAYNLILHFKRKKAGPGTFRGKVVVITGASSGIGHALALKNAELGASLVLGARREDRLAELKQEYLQILKEKAKDDAAHVITVRVDVTIPSECKNLIETTLLSFKVIDILILNAGISGGKIPFAEWGDFNHARKVMDTNYWGTVYPLFYALPALKKSKAEHGAKASLVIVSSLSGQTGTSLRTAYAASKFALHGLEQSLRFETTDFLNVTAICPGYVLSEIHDKELARMKMKRNLAQFMTAEECARRMIDSQFNGDRLVLMTFTGSLLRYVRPFMPDPLLDYLIESGSSGAFAVECE